MTRTDPHRPGAIVPDDYEYVGQECLKIECLADCYVLQAERANIRAHMTRTGGAYSHHEHGGNCGVCGSVNTVYTILYWHRPSNTYVRMGSDCAAKCDMGGDTDGGAFRAAVQDALAAQAGKRKAQAVLTEAGLTRCWDLYATPGFHGCECGCWCNCAREWERAQGWRTEEPTIIDIVRKLIQYGGISEAQERFLGTLLARIDGRAERDAAEAAARALAADCPTGRLVIEGVVLGLKEQESEYGIVTKMLVQADSGYKVWGTRTANANKGDRVQFRATVTPSRGDTKFGFFSRPAERARSKRV